MKRCGLAMPGFQVGFGIVAVKDTEADQRRWNEEIERISKYESARGIEDSASWHAQYKDSAYIFIGGIPYELTEGDVVCVFSQYGEVLDINLARDPETGKSKGFAFLAYEDQRSTVLAVDNLNGIKLLGRTIRVDHVGKYRRPKKRDSNGKVIEDDGSSDNEPVMNAAPPVLEPSALDAKQDDGQSQTDDVGGLDPDDPMYEYYRRKMKKRAKKKERKRKREQKPMKRDRTHRDSANK